MERRTAIGLALKAQCLMALCCAEQARAQRPLDRADPSITEQALPAPARRPQSPAPTVLPRSPLAAVAATVPPRMVRSIIVEGGAVTDGGRYAAVTAPFAGRALSTDDLSHLATAVSAAARAQGYPFASASIPAQPIEGGVLRVRLDEGRITAVRVIGADSPLADRILGHALVTGRPVRRDELERAILLVGDIPGLVVKESRYVQQDGFGILIVTVSEDRAFAYAQLDNRGSKEVGPFRSTVLASLRDLAGSGDELGVIVANTPFQPSEFAFVRGRYSAAVDDAGSVVSASASYGRAHPGAALSALDVIGHSMDAAASYTRPLIRSRARSLSASIEFRALKSDQALMGVMLRDDKLTTLTGSLSGTATLGPGALRADVSVVGGLPLNGVTHEGDPLASRRDGDARFALFAFSADWAARLTDRFSLAVASAGQVASRPLLATMEIGAGGPGFGRGYDYAERTGDNGVLGSVELRFDTARLMPRKLFDRFQLYGFVDGGYVDNLRRGFGGGSLLSSGAGARIGRGRLDGMFEVAFPLNADRFDTGNRDPRLSLRISRSM